MYSAIHRYTLRAWLAPLLIVALTMPAALCLCSDHAAAAREIAAADTACCKGGSEHQEEEQGDEKGCCGASALACACAPSLLQADFQEGATAPATGPSATDSIVTVDAARLIDVTFPPVRQPGPIPARSSTSRPLHQVHCVQIC